MKTVSYHRFFFDQDDSSHWYMVPERFRDVWEASKRYDMDTDEGIDRFERLFRAYRTGGGINHISFENPSEG